MRANLTFQNTLRVDAHGAGTPDASQTLSAKRSRRARERAALARVSTPTEAEVDALLARLSDGSPSLLKAGITPPKPAWVPPKPAAADAAAFPAWLPVEAMPPARAAAAAKTPPKPTRTIHFATPGEAATAAATIADKFGDTTSDRSGRLPIFERLYRQVPSGQRSKFGFALEDVDVSRTSVSAPSNTSPKNASPKPAFSPRFPKDLREKRREIALLRAELAARETAEAAGAADAAAAVAAEMARRGGLMPRGETTRASNATPDDKTHDAKRRLDIQSDDNSGLAAAEAAARDALRKILSRRRPERTERTERPERPERPRDLSRRRVRLADGESIQNPTPHPQQRTEAQQRQQRPGLGPRRRGLAVWGVRRVRVRAGKKRRLARARVGRGGAPPRRGGGVGGRGSRARRGEGADQAAGGRRRARAGAAAQAQGGHRLQADACVRADQRRGGGERGVARVRVESSVGARTPERDGKGTFRDGKGINATERGPGDVPGDVLSRYPRNIRESRGGAVAAHRRRRRARTARGGAPGGKRKRKRKRKRKEIRLGRRGGAFGGGARPRAREREAAKVAAAAATAAAAKAEAEMFRARRAAEREKNPSSRQRRRRRRSSRRRRRPSGKPRDRNRRRNISRERRPRVLLLRAPRTARDLRPPGSVPTDTRGRLERLEAAKSFRRKNATKKRKPKRVSARASADVGLVRTEVAARGDAVRTELEGLRQQMDAMLQILSTSGTSVFSRSVSERVPNAEASKHGGVSVTGSPVKSTTPPTPPRARRRPRGRQVRAGVAAARARTRGGPSPAASPRAAAIPADRRAEIPVKSANPFLSG